MKIGSLFFCLAAVLFADVIPIPVRDGVWEAKLFQTGEAPEAKAARFSIEGKTLSVGPWRAGRYSARYEYSEKLPLLDGQVQGRYKTEGVLPYTAAVFVSFHDGSARPETQVFELAPSSDWREFKVPIRRPPQGSKRVTLGFGLTEKTDGRVWFADLSVSTEPYHVEFPESPGRVTRPAPPSKLPATGSFRLIQQNGAWWLVRPDGTPFYSTGTDGPFDLEPGSIVQGLKYVETMRWLGFNSLAGWTNPKSWGPVNDALVAKGELPLAMFKSLQTGTTRGDFDRLVGGDHAFPDPFDPRWEATLRQYVRSIAEPLKGKSWFAGFFADNEINHRDLHRHVYTPHCSAALRAFLEKRYRDISELNRAWGTEFESFADLIAKKPDPVVREGAMYEDFRQFKREIVRRYVETALRVIREEAPGRLVFSNRFMLDDCSEWLDVLDLYKPFDGIGVNIYPANLSAGLNDSERMLFRLVHEKTGKPIIVPEWSVPALDSGLYNKPDKLDWSYRETVDTQEERARQTAKIIVDFYNMPFVAGAHWFIWKDFDSEKRQANRGLFKASGEPWTKLQEAIRDADRLIQASFSDGGSE